MTDIDTTKIRTRPVPTRPLVLALCDALDAARAERDDLAYTPNRLVKAAIARAEAAEARVLELDVMVGLMREDNNSDMNRVRRALTGGTK